MKLKLLGIALVMLCVQNVFSQAKTVTGVVTDESGIPLPGVNVIIKATTTGTTTDFDGNYKIANVNTNSILVFSYIGFATREITFTGQSQLNVTLEEDTSALDEVVVVGYGKQSRAEVTGAVSSIASKEIAALPVSNPEEALQGRAAGVLVVNTGSPGAAPVVRIRGVATFGDNSPLYVVDGVIVGGLSAINPSDIESINVLKDASTTAVYGAQGANGVIVVTTKSGKSEQPTLEFSSFAGFQTQNERYDVLNTLEYLKYANDAFGTIPNSPFITSGNNTDWQDEIYRTGLIQSYDVAYSGGGESENFRFSAGYLEREGIIKETGFERYSFRVNSNFERGKFKFGQTLGLNFSTQNPELVSGGRSLLEHAIKSAPYLPVYNSANLGGFQGPSNSGDGQDAENPVRVMEIGDATNKSVGILGNVYGEYEITSGLTFKTNVGLDYFNFNNDSFTPSYDDNDGTHAQTFSQVNKNSGFGKVIIFTNSLNYNKTFSDLHNLELLLLAEDYNSTFEGTSASSRNEITDEIQQVVQNASTAATSGSNEYNRIGYVGRVNYNYDNKYLLAASLRRDASSRFGENNRWGWFPSVAVGWNIANESFMSDSVFNNLKLRGSWGIAGNDKIGNYLYSATLNSIYTYPINDTPAVGTTSAGLANADLKWEENEQLNVGLDFGLLNNRITGSIEYFKSTSEDLLVFLPTPTSLGNPSGGLTQNAGSVESSGFELVLGYRDTSGDFTWSADFNLGTTSNNTISTAGLSELTGGTFENEDITRVAEGESLFHFYGLVTDGIYQNQAEVEAVFTKNPGQTTVQPGDIRFKDINEDGDITEADRVKIGDPFPDITYGLNINANYKNLDFNMFINGLQGRDVYNTNIYDLEGMPRLFNAGTAVLNRWQQEGDITNVPRAGGAPQNLAISDRFVEDGSYVRLKNITVGYTLPDTVAKDVFSSLRFYVSAQNLFTITNYSGLDPEVANGNSFNFGIDRGGYPQPKTFLLGVQAKF
jgi:TonB-linked SusC/RagA family outer membrane protein